jgi:hypothetical protein
MNEFGAPDNKPSNSAIDLHKDGNKYYCRLLLYIG